VAVTVGTGRVPGEVGPDVVGRVRAAGERLRRGDGQLRLAAVPFHLQARARSPIPLTRLAADQQGSRRTVGETAMTSHTAKQAQSTLKSL
jgi:hypothetical protein